MNSARSSLIAHRSSLALIAVFALILLLPALLQQEVFTLRDHFDYFQPLRWFTAQELQAGRLPLWNPYNASGEPWLANPQTGVFYPPAWLFVILPFATAYMLYLYAHLALLGCGAYLLFRRSASEGAALVGAAALMFSGPVLSLLDVSNNLATLAWIPLALWCAAEGAWRRGGIVLALAFLGGEPFFAGIAAVLYVVVALSRRAHGTVILSRVDGEGPPAGAASSRPMRGSFAVYAAQDDSRGKRLLFAALIALGLSAIQLFPFLEFVRRSDRAAGLDPELILMHSMSLGDWLRIAVPPKLGLSAIDANLSQHFIPMVYVGIAVCILALLGIRRRTVPWLALLAVTLVISLGPRFLTQLPITLFRYPARLVPLAAIAIAALAVAGWERVRPNRRWVDLVVVLVVLLDLAPHALPLLQSAPFRVDVVPYPRAVGQETKILRVGALDARQRPAWIAGYLNLYERRFDMSTASPLASDDYMRMYRALQEKPSKEGLAQNGIGWILTSVRLGLRPAARAGNVTAYLHSDTMPMAFLIMRNPMTAVPARARLDSTSARVTVDAPREGVLVLLQQNAPGWRAEIDGREARTFPVGDLFRGVQLTRGPHEVVWRYRPWSLFFGASVTCLTLLAMTLSLFVKRTR